jgi:hypothetical protein
MVRIEVAPVPEVSLVAMVAFQTEEAASAQEEDQHQGTGASLEASQVQHPAEEAKVVAVEEASPPELA